MEKKQKTKFEEKFPEIEIFEDKDNMLKSIKKKVSKKGNTTKIDYEFGIE